MREGVTSPPPVWTTDDEPARSALQNSQECDLAIVGGGIVGLTAAEFASRHDLRVCVVEADRVGSGASGSNAAGVAPIWGAQTPAGVVGVFGDEQAAILNAALATACIALLERARSMPGRCDVVEGGFLALAARADTAASLAQLSEQWQRAGADVTLLGKKIALQIDSPRYVEGLLFGAGGTLNPLAYVAGLARLSESQGVRIFEKSPVVEVRRQSNGRWTVVSGAGRLDAATVVLAVHGATGMGRELDRIGCRIDCQLIGSTPLTQAQQIALPRAPTFADLDDASIFGGTLTADGRLVATVLPGPGALSISNAGDVYGSKLARAFPGIAPPQWESMSGGHIIVTRNKLPQLLQLAPGMYAGHGCNGYGLCAGTLLGEDLARVALQRAEMPHRFPLEVPRVSRLARLIPSIVRHAVPVVRRFS
jgi:glycine/D-amino acid oxidase-like deaminating enzyme